MQTSGMEILHQLADLFIGAIPTVIMVFLFYFFLRPAFFKPIEYVLAERRARIEGAQREAENARKLTEEKRRERHHALQKIRSEIYAEQEGIRRAALDERAELTRQTRERANQHVRAEKQRIREELQSSRLQLEPGSHELAGEIVRLILERPAPRRTSPEA